MKNLKETIEQFCKKHALRMNTDLGQHFLIDDDVLEAILEAAAIKPGEKVVEIGAGIGILTKELVRRTPDVMTVEIDRRLIPLMEAYIKEDEADLPQPNLVQGNALSVPFPETPYKIVANIPYHITSPLLRHAFLEGKGSPVSLTLLIQREVAEKICDKEDASMLTVIVALFGDPRIVINVPPECFLPPPKVDSAVLHIDCFSEPKTSPEIIERVFILTKHAFSQKRKMLRNTIPNLPGGEEWLKKADIDPQRRPQTLSIEEWIKLAEVMDA
jgi:16S rRNA (adenine1518-N6/adenine1519-N6)-dimethyltransferase